MNADKIVLVCIILLAPLIIYLAYTFRFMGGTSSQKMSAPVIVNASAKHTATVSTVDSCTSKITREARIC